MLNFSSIGHSCQKIEFFFQLWLFQPKKKKSKNDNQLANIKEIALKTNLSIKQVKYWFDFKRFHLKSKKLHSKALKTLLNECKKNQKPNEQTLNKLASELNLTLKHIKKWFKKERKCYIIYLNGDKYYGYMKDGQHSGKGIYYNKNGNIQYNGEWKDGKLNGCGIEYFTQNDTYVGEFKDGKRNGKGTFIFSDGSKYLGDWLNEKRHGKGCFISADGSKYIGDYLNDKRDGEGIEYYSNGDIFFKGLWKKGHKNGYGIEYFNSFPFKGDLYKGEFKDGKRSGKGTFIKANGCKYVGNWSNNKRNGNGIYYNANGLVEYDGDWINGKPLKK